MPQHISTQVIDVFNNITKALVNNDSLLFDSLSNENITIDIFKERILEFSTWQDFKNAVILNRVLFNYSRERTFDSISCYLKMDNEEAEGYYRLFIGNRYSGYILGSVDWIK